MVKQRTWVAKKEEHKADWFVVDAKDKILGRLAVDIARVLMGKHKPTYTPHVDTGDFIIVLNADKFRVTGKKRELKIYGHYTGYLSGWRTTPLEDQLEKHPLAPLKHAVRLMLPKNNLAKYMLKKLKLYTGTEHPHAAQAPSVLEFG